MQPPSPWGELHHDRRHDPPPGEPHRGQLALPLPLTSNSEESSSQPIGGHGNGKVQDDERETFCHQSSSSAKTPSMTKVEAKPGTSEGARGGVGGGGGAKKSSKSEESMLLLSPERSQSKQSHHSQPHCPVGRMHLSSVLRSASTRCFTVSEMIQLLSPETTPLTVSSVGPDPTSPPPSGSLLLYDRAETPNYRDDGHDWVKKNVESYRSRLRRKGRGGGEGGEGESRGNSILIVREDSVKLRYNGRFHVAGYYTRSAVRRTFRRRAYYLVDPANGSRPLSNWILVHYLDAEPRRAHVGGGGGCGCDAPGTLVGSSVPTNQPAPVPGVEKTGMGSSSAAASTSGIDNAARREDREPDRRPPEAMRIGGEGTATVIASAADDDSRRSVLVADPGMTHRFGGAFPAALGSGHHRWVEDPRWDAAGTGGPKRGDRGTVTGSDPHDSGGGGTLPIGVIGRAEATGDEEPRDLPRPAASARCWRGPTEPPGADVLGSSAPVISAAFSGVSVCGGKPSGGKGVDSVNTMEVNVGLNPYLHIPGGQPENPPKPQYQHQHQQKQSQPQHQESSLDRMIRSLSDLRNAPKFNCEHLAHEWRCFTEEERRELIADLYGSVMVPDGGGAGANGGTGPTDTGAGATRCGDDDVPPSSRSCGTSPFVRELMAEMEALRMSLMAEAVLEGMPPDCADRTAYLEAVKRCPEQASSRRMKSWFLRCEDQCPKAAAHRMVRYWKKRVEYFGPERAFLPFTLGDGGTLGTDEFHDEIATGFARILPGTDASGRGIMLIDNSKRCSFATKARVILYMSHVALENESVVRNGLVLIAFGPVRVQDADPRLILERQQLLRDSLPVRIRAMHWCNPMRDNGDWISRDAHEVANFTAGRMWRARVLLHQGSREHLVLQLGKYGISLSELPAKIGEVW